MRHSGPFLLHGVACGRCGHPGHRHDPRTGLTEHVSAAVPPCRTKPPTDPRGARP